MSRRPADWEPWEEEAVAPLRDEIDALGQQHRRDPSIHLLRAAEAGALPDSVEAPVTDALARSAWNRALVEGADAAEAVLRQDADARILDKIRQERADHVLTPARRLRAWVPALALAGAAALVLVAIRSGSKQIPASTGPASEPTVAATTPAPFRLSLDKPEIKLTPAALVLRRGEPSSKLLDAIAPAVNAYRSGDYQTAIDEFTKQQPLYPASVEIPFYLGVSRLFVNDAPGAVTALQAARRVGNDAFDADISWYLAVASERAGDLASARGELKTLCGGHSSYAARACDGLSKF